MNVPSEPDYLLLEWPPFTESNLFIPPNEWHFGGEEPDLIKGELKVHIGNRPMVQDLRQIPEKELTDEQRKDVLRLRKGYELWLVTYTVGIVSTSELWSISALGLKVAYHHNETVLEKAEKSVPSGIGIIDALPQTQFITNVEGSIGCHAEIGFDGRFKVPKVPVATAGVPLSVNGKIAASPNIKMAGQVSFAVKSTLVHTIGEGSDFGQWEVKRHKDPLLGTHYFQHVIRVPGRTQKIYATLRVAAVARGFFGLPARIESKPVTLEIAAG